MITPLGQNNVDDDYYSQEFTFQQNVQISCKEVLQQNFSTKLKNSFIKDSNVIFQEIDEDEFKEGTTVAKIGEIKEFVPNKFSKKNKQQDDYLFIKKDDISPFEDEEINSPDLNTQSPTLSYKIIPTSSIFIPSLHKRKQKQVQVSELNIDVEEKEDVILQQTQRCEEQIQELNVQKQEKENNQSAPEEYKYPSSNSIILSMKNTLPLSKENSMTINSYKDDKKIESLDRPSMSELGGRNEMFKFGNSSQTQERLEYNENYKQSLSEQKQTQGIRSQADRKQSLFKYDPSMFQSVAGYFYPSSSVEQANAFDTEMVSQSIKESKFKDEQQRNQFLKFVKIYLIEKKRVYIQRINREISGLKSAENMGDYFMRRYNNDQEKRVAGCAQAQKYPVYIGVRGDGNCFYRGVIVSYLVHLISNEKRIEDFQKLIEEIENENLILVNLEYQGKVREDKDKVKIILLQNFLSILGEIKRVKDKIESAIVLMRMFDRIATDHDLDYSLVCLCRSMILQPLDQFATNSVYSEYILQDDIERTKLKLLQYKEDAEYHVLSLSTEVFKYPLQILSLQKDKWGHAEFSAGVTFTPQISQIAERDKKIYLLLSDGHYDLVFDRNTCVDFFPSLSLFSQHKRYKDDLIQLCANNEKNQRQILYSKLLGEYSEFLKDQNGQISKMRKSFVHLHTISRPEKNIQEDLDLFDTMMDNFQAKGLNQQESIVYFKGIDKQKDIDQIYEIEENSKTNEDDLPPLNQRYNSERIPYNNQFQTKNGKNSQEQNGMQFKKQQILDLKQQHSAPEHNIQQFKNHQLDETEQQDPSQLSNVDFSSLHYYSLGSDRQSKQNALQNFKALLKSDLAPISSRQQRNSSQSMQSLNVCSHAAEVQITIERIVCCKQNLSVCFPCFKTRQIIPCFSCKKELFSEPRIATTTKQSGFACKTCNSLNPNIVSLFNKLYCTFCNIQQNYQEKKQQ